MPHYTNDLFAVRDSDGSGTARNLGLGFWKCHGGIGIRQVELGYSFIFCQIYTSYLMIFQSLSLFYLTIIFLCPITPTTCLRSEIVTDRVWPETWVSGFGSAMEKWV